MRRTLAQRQREPSPSGTALVVLQPPIINAQVAQYFTTSTTTTTNVETWRSKPEFPTSQEVMNSAPPVAPNKRRGAFEDQDAYLQAQYNFLRREAVTPLAEAVSNLRNTPQASEETFGGEHGIYEKVHIIGYRTSTRGVAIRVTFSTRRVGKKVLWAHSKRLITGSLVALTPVYDMFDSQCIVATVAARTEEALQKNPPEIELFFARPEELVIDAGVEWLMVEARSSFFPAQQYTMSALQRMSQEPFPLHQHLVCADTTITAPAYVQNEPNYNLSAIYPASAGSASRNILNAWPQGQRSDLDASQQAAIQRILTKGLAIVQGPPGTGKTFVSVKALQVLLANRKHDDPPIVVTAQTNHALDQLLRHIAAFEPSFARVGGMSKDKGVILPRTLYNLREASRESMGNRQPKSNIQSANAEMRRLESQIKDLMAPLQHSDGPLDPKVLKQHNLITESQADSLHEGASKWTQTNLENPHLAKSPFTLWAKKTLNKIPYKPQLADFGFEIEAEELEYEELLEVEAEAGVNTKQDEFVDGLHGNTYTLAVNYTCRATASDMKAAERALQQNADLWKIPEALRGPLYRLLQIKLGKKLLAEFKDLVKQYDKAAQRRQIGRFELDEIILREQKIIGLTTTGLSKYRGLLVALGCKIILVEEAAETLEAPVAVACIPTLQHLILVGDHKQLRPHCQLREHEGKPLYYDISMFERIIDNELAAAVLTEQRRMRTEIRRCLRPIYGDFLTDHSSVNQRPDVPGMGGVNSWFFTHSWPERRDDNMSCINPEEADMIVGFVRHLASNGMDTRKITLLTFYNGQRKTLQSAFRGTFKGPIVTVDSYQGEENEVVILSLVRSNDSHQIGFLSNDNRICVAISRAQSGFYIFGNALTLNSPKLSKRDTWLKVIKVMAGHDYGNPQARSETPTVMSRRFDEKLPIYCTKHKRTLAIQGPADWDGLEGGCRQACGAKLDCGHDCPLTCHPYPHDLVACDEPCEKTLPCGHRCTLKCSQACVCSICDKSAKKKTKLDGVLRHSPHSSSGSSVELWLRFAKEAPKDYEQACSSRSDSPLKNGVEQEELLIDI